MYEEPAYGQYPAEREESPRSQLLSEPVRRPVPPVSTEAAPEPTADRLLVHLGWEALLAVAVVLLAVALHRDRPELFRGAGFDTLLVTVDVPVAGARLRDARNGMSIPPALTPRTVIDALPRPWWWFDFLTTEPLAFASLGALIGLRLPGRRWNRPGDTSSPR